MGRLIVYCSICGCLFEDISCEPSEGEFDEAILLPDQTKWLAQFRVIGKADFERNQDNGYGPFAISPPASGADFCHLVIEIDHPENVRREVFRGRADIRRWGVYQRSGIVIYPLHDACLEIMQRVSLRNATCGNTRYGALEDYYNAMLRLTERNTQWPWDTTGGRTFSFFLLTQKNMEATSWNGSTWTTAQRGSPMARAGASNQAGSIPGLTYDVLSHLQPLVIGESCDPAKPRVASLLPTHTATTFEALPSEIINQIISFLPAIPALRLRRCSSTLYAKIPLDQKFWLAHLVSGDLVDYLWDLDAEEIYEKHKQGCWDWKQLAQVFSHDEIIESALAKSLRGGVDMWTTAFEKANMHKTKFRDAPIELQNRCRMMKVVTDFERIDEAEAKDKSQRPSPFDGKMYGALPVYSP